MFATVPTSGRDRLYGRRWRVLRLAWLRQNPLCWYCRDQGIDRVATVVDHIVPHRGDPRLFWDQQNWQPLCQPHHDSTKAMEEQHGGARIGCDVHGIPLARGGGVPR